MKFTAHEFTKWVTSLRAQAITVATVAGTGVDCRNASEVMAVMDVAALGGTAPTLDVTVHESDALAGTYTAIAGAVFPQFTATIDDREVVGRVNMRNRTKPFLKLVAIGAGTTPTGSFCGGLVLVSPTNAPLAPVNTLAFNV